MNASSPPLEARPLSALDAPALPALAVLAAVLLWGGSFSTMKTALTALDPATVMWVRLTMALAALAPLARRLVPRSARPGDWKILAALAALQPCLYFLCESNALRFTTSAQAGVISSSVPLLVALGARVFLAEALAPRTLAGLVLSMAGVAWLTLAGSPQESAPAPLLGNVLELAAMACAAGYMLLVKDLSGRYGTWTLTALQTLAGVVFFLPGAGPVLSGAVLDVQPRVLWSLVYLGLGASLGAFGLYNWGMARLPAARAASCINLIPVVAVVLGWAFLGEALNAAQMAASVLVLAGVWVSRGR